MRYSSRLQGLILSYSFFFRISLIIKSTNPITITHYQTTPCTLRRGRIGTFNLCLFCVFQSLVMNSLPLFYIKPMPKTSVDLFSKLWHNKRHFFWSKVICFVCLTVLYSLTALSGGDVVALLCIVNLSLHRLLHNRHLELIIKKLF